MQHHIQASFLRFLYTFLFYLMLPLICLRLLWRSCRLPAYRAHWGERFGFYPFRLEKCLWVHAVSMGEVIAALPLIRTLKNRYPALPIVITTMTPTGRERVRLALGNTVHTVYLPYDLPYAVKQFLKATHPVLGIIIETELWPNLLHYCYRNDLPLCLANARLSSRSMRGYRRILGMAKPMLQAFTAIAVNSQQDADRLIALGAPKERVQVTGNIKFDIKIEPALLQQGKALRQWLGQERLVWIAASTHPGEEEIILAAHKELLTHCREALLILVPRHPDRFEAVAALCAKTFSVSRRSIVPTTPHCATTVFLGDTMGELLLFYSA